MKITLRQIEVFVSIAQRQTMTAASDALALSQSACSMALSNLESQLGTLLFERNGKNLLLNEQGRSLLPKAINILSHVHEFETCATNSSANVISGHLVIGASTTVGNYILPRYTAGYLSTHKNMDLSLTVSNTENVIDDILHYKIDIGFIEGRCYHADIEVIPWMKDELIIIAAPEHPLTKMKAIALSKLTSEKWIFREAGSGTRELTDELLQGRIRPFMTLGNTEAIKQAVISGFGISCVSKLAVINELAANQLHQLDVKNLHLSRTLSIILHRRKHKTEVLNRFIEALHP